jgi:hypothetical protein
MAAYPLLGRGRGWVYSFKSIFLLHLAFLTHPCPSNGGDKQIQSSDGAYF